MDRPLRIAFLHPDLGLGGAERLVVDAALELGLRGHRVSIFTGGHDPARAFVETVDGRLDVRVHGRFVPLHVGGRARASLAIAKMALGARAIARDREPPDVVFCDVVPHVIPQLRRLCADVPVVFYCHFPDRLLTPPRRGLYRWYRRPIDALERSGTAQAARVLVNSRYTAGVFARTYPSLPTPPDVVYPGVDVERWRPGDASLGRRANIVSIARFERSKNAILVIQAFERLRATLPHATFEPLRVVIAGGYDGRLPEAARTLDAMGAWARAHGLADRVEFRHSLDDAALKTLVAGALCVAYTPDHEHFGYAPVEAMASGRPVVAVASGGPLETVVDGETGFLVEPTADAFAAGIGRLASDPALADRMGAAGRARAVRLFSRSAFGARIDAVARAVTERPS
jgi:alpha-1,3/alpha-1,6-mannosyltransferase